MLSSQENYSFKELLDEPLYFNIEGILTVLNFTTNGQPLTLRDMYPHLQKIKLQELSRKKAFTEEEFRQLKKDRESGLSIKALSKKYNKCTATIQKYLKMEV